MNWISDLAETANDFAQDYSHNVERVFPLHSLWYSSDDLNERFDIDPAQQQSLVIFSEEVREFVEAYSNHKMGVGTHEEIVGEFGDLIVVAFQLMRSAGITDIEDVIDGITKVIAKNNAKTRETHEFDPASNKIVRRR
jgi:NTP pyrophosphatase (non-canonical NTP hydrolase)